MAFRQGLHIHVCLQHFNTRSRLDQGVFFFAHPPPPPPPKKNLLKQNGYTPSKWWRSPLYDVQHFHGEIQLAAQIIGVRGHLMLNINLPIFNNIFY
jgi:hypothetical protein